MKKSFGGRDTARDWQIIAESDPFRGVLTRWSDQHRDDPEFLDKFYTTGRHHIRRIVNLVRQRVEPDFKPVRGLDFGCGTGRLLAAMGEVCDEVYGIDISERMLEISHDVMTRLGLKKPVLARSIEGLRLEAGIDWLNSHIVFQHIPPEQGLEVLSQLLSVVRVGGVATIHFTNWYGPMASFPDGSSIRQRMKGILRWRSDGNGIRILRYRDTFPDGSMQMYTYDMNELCGCLQEFGFEEYYLVPTNHREIYGFIFLTKRMHD